MNLTQNSTLFKKTNFIDGKDSLPYQILYPPDYDANKKYPLVVFLHGAGERGNDNEVQTAHAGVLFADPVNREKYPAFVIFPQCAAGDFWARIHTDPEKEDALGPFIFKSGEPIGKSLGLVEKLINSITGTLHIDPDRVYIGGLSMGAMGTFELLWRKPRFFAAAFAICGGGDPSKVSAYAKNFPIWVFHGTDDEVVPVTHSRTMADSLQAAGAKVKLTEYPGVAHDSWTNALAEPHLLDWLFDQKK